MKKKHIIVIIILLILVIIFGLYFLLDRNNNTQNITTPNSLENIDKIDEKQSEQNITSTIEVDDAVEIIEKNNNHSSDSLDTKVNSSNDKIVDNDDIDADIEDDLDINPFENIELDDIPD